MRLNIRRLIPFFGLALALVAYSPAVAMENEGCLDCHAEVDEVGENLFIDQVKFDNTAHAEEGCTSCHEVTSEHPNDGVTPSEKASCEDCHDAVSGVYVPTAHAENASCMDCHNPHVAKGATAVSGYAMNEQCAACHDQGEMLEAHSKWLPQAELHMGAAACVTCHTKTENFSVTFYMVKGDDKTPYSKYALASYGDLQKVAQDQDVKSLIDADGDGLVTVKELKAFKDGPSYSAIPAIRLKGMMTPESVTHDFQIFENRKDCSFCHAAGAAKMQVSYVAVPVEDGSYSRIAVEDGAVVNPLGGMSDFYILGSTRHWVLDIIGLLFILGGLLVPAVHGSFRFLTRKNRKGGH